MNLREQSDSQMGRYVGRWSSHPREELFHARSEHGSFTRPCPTSMVVSIQEDVGGCCPSEHYGEVDVGGFFPYSLILALEKRCGDC